MKPSIKRLLAAFIIVCALAAAFFLQSSRESSQAPAPSFAVTSEGAHSSASEDSAGLPSVSAEAPEADTQLSETSSPDKSGQSAAPKPTQTVSPAASAQPADEKTQHCSLTVSCATILNNLDKLTAGKEALVPSDGVLLALPDATFTAGETVFDVLKRELKSRELHLEFTLSPLYNTAYINGICNLYEFDCGALSGWLYSVNSAFPSIGCNQYTLNDGDAIAFIYTCDLGRDVGKGA